jgi:hypothetical protein
MVILSSEHLLARGPCVFAAPELGAAPLGFPSEIKPRFSELSLRRNKGNAASLTVRASLCVRQSVVHLRTQSVGGEVAGASGSAALDE